MNSSEWVAFVAKERVTVNGRILQTVLVKSVFRFEQLIARIPNAQPGQDYEVLGTYSTPQEAWDRAAQWLQAGGSESDVPACGLN